MKKQILFSALFLLIGSSLSAQKKIEGHWGKQFLDIAYATAATNDGGYITTGLTKNGMDDAFGDIVVIKTDSKGDTMWTMVYGGPKLEGGNSVIQTADGGYLVAGHTEDFGARDCDAFMMKLDKNGNRQWFKVYGGDADDICEGVTQLPDGGYAFAGITASYGNPPTDSETRHVYFVRTNSTGDITWSKNYGGKASEYAYSIASMPQDGFLAAGWSLSFGKGEYDGWLFRLNGSGDTLWTRLYKNQGDTKYYKIIPTMDNGYVIAGYTTINKTSKPQGLVIKLDADGQQVWERTYGEPYGGMILNGAAQLPDGNLIFCGTNYADDTLGQAYILTTTPDGIKIANELTGGSNSAASGIAVQGNNSYLVAGITAQYGDNNGDLYYMEVDNTTSGILGVSFVTPHLFPNPLKDRSTLILPGTEAYQSTQVEVMNLSGKVVYSQKNVMGKDIVLNRAGLPSGIYTFRISCNDGRIFKGKFDLE